MKKLALTIAALAIAAPVSVFASSGDTDDVSVTLPGLEEGVVLGADEAAITAAITALGFEVEETETEDGMIEVSVKSAQGEAEIYVDMATGMIVADQDDD